MIHPRHAIWWHVYPLGAAGAPWRRADASDWEGRRLGRLEAWLDYAVELGVDGLLLGPVFASESHGYDTLDHLRLDPRLGDDADWDAFAAAAQRRGLSLVLDGVFNHVAAEHPAVETARAGGGIVALTDGATRGWEGHGGLAELDHADPRTADLAVNVMNHWLDRGAAGWRLDVGYAVPSAFWRDVLGRVRATHPDAFFLGEAIHGDYPAMARAGGWDAVTAYELWKATWSSLVDRNLWELAWALERHATFCEQTIMQTFVGNHDVDRIASVAGDAGAALAAVVLLTVPGLPSVYYGDEQAFRGVKGTGFSTDDALRPPLPASPADLYPGGWWLYRLHQDLIGLRRRHPWLFDGRLAVLAKTNETIAYEVAARDGSHRLEVALDLSGPRARITIDDAPALEWPR